MSRLEDAILAAGAPIQHDENGFVKKFVFDSDFIGFDGHFPDMPILPAVVQLMTGSMTAIEAAGKPLESKGVSRAKFLKQIGTDDRLIVQGILKSKGENTLAAITIRVADEVASTFTVTLSEKDNQ